MRKKKVIIEYRYLAPPEPRPERHKRMFDEAGGFVFHTRTPLAGYPRKQAPKAKAEGKRRKRWMFSKDVCKYVGCSLRHLYWLIRERRFPYYVYESAPSPRYVFDIDEVNDWLRKYRGKGRVLGLLKEGLNKRFLRSK